MTRRSTRLSKRSASPTPQDVPRKRPRTKRAPEQSTTQEGSEPRKRRRIAGKLASIMNMPVEVFCEVASYLSPEDLLRIARASKGLRDLLMSKSSRVIWTAAEKSIEIPPCPPDLSSPQYASLVFDKFCMNCLAPRARPVNIWERERLCKRCEAAKMDSEALIPDDELFRMPSSEEECVLAVTHVLDTSQHAREVENWLSRRTQDRHWDIKNLKQNRRASIYRRLKDLGYTQEDCSITRDDVGWKWDTLIDKPRELTEKGWAILRPRLENTIRLRREKKFRIARQECVTRRERLIEDFTSSVLKSNEVRLLLSFEELLQSPDVLKITYADGLEKMLSEDDFQVVKANVTELGTKRKQAEAEICGAAMAAAFANCGIRPANVMTEDCGEDNPSNHSSISASNVLEHSCALFALRGLTYIPSQASFNDLVLSHQPMAGKLSEWYAPNSQTILMAKRLAEDLNVFNLTLSELDSLKESFLCVRCDPIFRKRMNWQHLVQHFLQDKKDFERVKARYRGKLAIQTFFVNDHCLDNNSMGISAVIINSIGNALDMENLIEKCNCETCAKVWMGEHCKICTKIGAITTKLCEKGMRVHLQKKHGLLSEEAVIRELMGSTG